MRSGLCKSGPPWAVSLPRKYFVCYCMWGLINRSSMKILSLEPASISYDDCPPLWRSILPTQPGVSIRCIIDSKSAGRKPKVPVENSFCSRPGAASGYNNVRTTMNDFWKTRFRLFCDSVWFCQVGGSRIPRLQSDQVVFERRSARCCKSVMCHSNGKHQRRLGSWEAVVAGGQSRPGGGTR
jgi:hypothetical protein